MTRGLVIVLDSAGIGGAPDAAAYGDLGADTIGHIAVACEKGDCNIENLRSGPLYVPTLERLGLGRACQLATGRIPPGLGMEPVIGQYGSAFETSRGKDTPSGHWELFGVPVTFDWGYFSDTSPCFPHDLVADFMERGEIPGILGNCHASGTQIIAELGEEHMRSGKPICYTSADSVFQIAAHEETFGLDRLYDLCAIGKELLEGYRIGRVIARPFIGAAASGFTRTGGRRDYSVPPPAPTLLEDASEAGRDVATVGKIDDIFAHVGTGRVFKAHGNEQIFDRTLEAAKSLANGGLLVSNFIDFDSLYGHRRDVAGYASALERFDRRLPELIDTLEPDDLLIVTADHGCDPTWRGTDHTREQVPVLSFSKTRQPKELGSFEFSEVAAMLAAHLGLPAQRHPQTTSPEAKIASA